ncbi:MAG: Serine/threonine protein phosphatase [Chthonomonadaceae bacterium]|nr:Serine/threonine protein phosphatase [Chthonomonadaceae bacterium]
MGNVRNSNQDSYAVLRRGDLSNRLDALLVLADGMGGTGGGDIASSMVAQAVPDSILEFLYERGANSSAEIEQMLRETFTRANHKVWTTRKFERPDLKQMGTTCVTAVVSEDVLTVANLGDSRAYLLRAGKLRQLTDDHSEVWQEVMANRMTREEAQNSRFRNRITRAIGLGPEVNTDIFRVPLQEGDTVLLCSDGLNGELRDAEIARIMAGYADIQEVCDRLVETALEHGGRDNVTVVALRYGSFVPLTLPVTTDEDDTDPEQAWRRQTRRPLDDEGLDDLEDEALIAPQPRRPDPRPTRVAPEPSSRRSRQQTGGTSGILVALLLLVTAVAAVEGYLLYQNGYFKPKPIEKVTVTPQKPVYDLHTYGAPKLMTTKEVQDACLLVDEQGNPMVASRNGNLIRVRSNGAVDLLGGTFPSLPPVPDTHRPSVGPARADFALDPNGNLFAIDAETKSIQIFSKSGTRVGYDIGATKLKSPVRIAVNPDDVIFVIDNHKLYRIEPATTTTGH